MNKLDKLDAQIAALERIAARKEKVGTDQTVILDLPEGVYKLLHAGVVLNGPTTEQRCLDRLNEIMTSWLDSDGPGDMMQQVFKGEKGQE